MVMTMPFGYGRTRVTPAQLATHSTFTNLHPEVQRRLMALLVAAEGHVGVGTAERSSAVQEHTFRDRYASGWGPTFWQGKRWHRVHGAPAAPPGHSFHEPIDHGEAMAIDLVGDLAWVEAHAHGYGFVTFTHVNREPWHIQPIEIPHSVTQWRRAGSPEPRHWSLPASHHHWVQPDNLDDIPDPTLKKGDTGQEVRKLQNHLHQWHIADSSDVRDPHGVDGTFGARTETSLKSFQKNILHVTADGMYGPKTDEAFTAVREYLAAQDRHPH